MVVLDLLKEYYRVEVAFQEGYEKGVQILRKQHSENVGKVAVDIFAHYYIAGRNQLAIKLIVCLKNTHIHVTSSCSLIYIYVECFLYFFVRAALHELFSYPS